MAFLLFPMVGIIPAGAGKSGTETATYAYQPDHPRGCGEKKDLQLPECIRQGSSPRVRGKANTATHRGNLDRIIPAGAGKSM